MASYDDLNNRQIFTVAIIAVALTFIAILASQVVYYALAERHQLVKEAQGRYVEGDTVLQQQSQTLDSYGVNEETGQLQVPVSEVMRRMAEHSDNQDHDSDSPEGTNAT